MELFLIKYGLVAVFFAAMAEADVVPVLTGVVANLGYFSFPLSIVVASGGAFAGDCVWFWIGRRHAEWFRTTRIYARTLVRNNYEMREMSSHSQYHLRKRMGSLGPTCLRRWY